MSISDALVGHLLTIYLGMIAAMKAYGLVTGQTFTGVFVLAASTAVVLIALVAALTWDVSRKVTYAFAREQVREMCRGGICWHGVAVKLPASQQCKSLIRNYRGEFQLTHIRRTANGMADLLANNALLAKKEFTDLHVPTTSLLNVLNLDNVSSMRNA